MRGLMSFGKEEFFKSKAKYPHLINLNRREVKNFLNATLDIVFPGMTRKNFVDQIDLNSSIQDLKIQLVQLLLQVNMDKIKAENIGEQFSRELWPISEQILKDAQATLDGDPAAADLSEVLLCYPGIFAIATYRVAHFLHTQGTPILPRMLSEKAHGKTGIDIHPGAKIGESFCIDHGTGVVIGETAVIGKQVKIYQGVTLGALSVDKSLTNKKRHPTLEDHTVIYANATILGGDTVIGHHSIVGGNVWTTKSIPPHSMAYHKNEVIFDAVKNLNAH